MTMLGLPAGLSHLAAVAEYDAPRRRRAVSRFFRQH